MSTPNNTIKTSILVVIFVLFGVLCITEGVTSAATLPLYLTQEATEKPQPSESLPRTLDEGVIQFILLLIICAGGLLGSFLVIKNKRKDSDGK